MKSTIRPESRAPIHKAEVQRFAELHTQLGKEGDFRTQAGVAMAMATPEAPIMTDEDVRNKIELPETLEQTNEQKIAEYRKTTNKATEAKGTYDTGESEVLGNLNEEISLFNNFADLKIERIGMIPDKGKHLLPIEQLIALHQKLDKIISDSSPNALFRRIDSEETTEFLNKQKEHATNLQKSIKNILSEFDSNFDALLELDTDSMLKYFEIAQKLPQSHFTVTNPKSQRQGEVIRIPFETLNKLSKKLEQISKPKRTAAMQKALFARMSEAHPAEVLARAIQAKNPLTIMDCFKENPACFDAISAESFESAHEILNSAIEHSWFWNRQYIKDAQNTQKAVREAWAQKNPASYLSCFSSNAAKLLEVQADLRFLGAKTEWFEAVSDSTQAEKPVTENRPAFKDLEKAYQTLQPFWGKPSPNAQKVQAHILEAMKSNYPNQYLKFIQSDADKIIEALSPGSTLTEEFKTAAFQNETLKTTLQAAQAKTGPLRFPGTKKRAELAKNVLDILNPNTTATT